MELRKEILRPVLGAGALALLAPAAPADPGGLLLHYSFDTPSGATVTNAAGPVDGPLVGGATVVPGQAGYGNALQGNRTGANTAAVDTNLSAVELAFAGGAYTAMAWVYWAGESGGSDHMVFSQFVGSNMLHHGLRADGGDNIIHFGHWTDDIYDAGVVPPDTWTHIAFSYDAASSPDARVYVNGALTGTGTTGPLDSAHHGEPIAIGFMGGQGSFNGLIDEVKVFNSALDAGAIAAQMSAPAALTANPDSATMHPGGKVRLGVLANDTGAFVSSSLKVLTPPSHGTATAGPGGTILYTHTAGTPTADTFTYEIAGATGTPTATATVTINLVTAGRFATDYVSMPAAPPVTGIAVVDAFPGLTFDSPHDIGGVPGDTRKLFVSEGDGRVWLVPDVTASPTDSDKLLILDITARVHHDDNEKAFKSVAPHPGWATNGYIYVTYETLVGTSRLSRFTCQTTPPYAAAAASELILIDQKVEGGIHGIDTCEFGPDGYLYVSFGDEGSQSDSFHNAQYIDKDLWSSIIRIDVDKKPGSLTPNPDDDVPRTGGGTSGEAFYAVPPDNPFVGATSHNGVAVDPTQVRTEMFITGLRNPWQFSVEDLDGDGTTDEVWVGDVGRGSREEIAVYNKGANGGWSWREGTETPDNITGDRNGADIANAVLTGPLWDYPHGGGPFEGNAAMAGFLYRGNTIPSLTGKFIAADYASGNIWSIERTAGAPVVERLGGELAIVAIEPDPSSGDILLLDRGNTGSNQGVGGIKRLAVSTDDSAFPQSLAATNFFADLGDLSPQPGAVHYQPNLRFWSDHATKRRWFLIKNTADTLGYSEDGPWSTPGGMLWVKHFDYPTEWESFQRVVGGQTVADRRPVSGSPSRRLETRFLVRTANGAYGVSYRWGDINGTGEQTGASLVADAGDSFTVDVKLDGAPLSVPWDIPPRNGCATCHTPAAGHALSINTRQLNAPGSIAGLNGNQVSLLAAAGYIANPPPSPPSQLPRHVRPDQTQYSLEARARSWLDVNCAYCHQAGGTGGGNWDGQLHLTLAATGLVNGTPVDAPLHPGDLLVTPGDASRSIIYSRAAAANGYSRMPPLATREIDYEGVGLLADWIASELQPHLSYDDFRIAHFGNLVSPEGAPGANPDGDTSNNLREWLANTNPNDHADDWTPTIRLAGGQVAIDFTGLGNRRVTFEHSLDLLNWSRWQAMGNDGIPRAPNAVHTLTAPALGREFFRPLVEEN